jgi:tRNA-splicing ligase RtcB (3'-phosphate/5'-hydroxy nucleic acid ligase)
MKMSNKLKTLIPLEELEQQAQQQIYEALKLPFLKTLAIMPGCHSGYHLPIEAVALLDGVVSPSYVGYDIGCGMCCVITDIPYSDIIGKEKHIFDNIYKKIPVGFNGHNDSKEYKTFFSASSDKRLEEKVNNKLLFQFGSLGSGNHFIEIGSNSTGNIGITIHSGSRNSGHSVASYYMDIAKNEFSELGKGFLYLDSDIGEAFLQDLDFMLQYALDNRLHMMKEVLKIIGFDKNKVEYYLKRIINENHNHAEVTMDGVLHRKGATPANKNQSGVIPGNMRDGVYITLGLGNEEYLNSASHGSGRTMSRTKAKESITIDEFKNSMNGVVAKVDLLTLDESPMAYKDLNMVIKRQEGIVVNIVDHIKSKINIKG